MSTKSGLTRLLITFGFTIAATYFGVEGSEIEAIGTLSSLLILILAFTQAIKVKFNLKDVIIAGSKAPHIVSAGLGLTFGTVGEVLEIGYFAIITEWYYGALVGLLISLSANGTYTFDTVKVVIEAIFGKPKATETVESTENNIIESK